MRKFNIHKIFVSISGEAGFIPQGAMTTFIRFQGCNLRCNWCDTVDAQDDAQKYRVISIDDIAESVVTKNVLITGGEPGHQNGLYELISRLELDGRFVQIETNGSIPFEYPLENGAWVVDYKLPSSGMMDKMLPIDTYTRMLKNTTHGIVKFVVDNPCGSPFGVDFMEMVKIIHQMNSLGYLGNWIISPVHANPLQLQRLVTVTKQSILSSKLDMELVSRFIFSLQIHKLCNLL